MKVLVIRFSSIGDIVLTTPVVRCLKQQKEAVELHYLTKSVFRPILEHNPYIDKVHCMDEGLNAAIEELKTEKFDYIIDLHHNLRTLRVKRALNIMSYSFPKLNIRKLLLVNFKINLMPDKSVVDRYFEAVRPLGVTNDTKGLDYFIPEDVKVTHHDVPMSHWAGYVGCVIGGSYNTKKLPVEKWKELCELIPYPIILMGGPEDREEGRQIAELDPVRIYNACGKFSLNESAELVRFSRMIVSNDTGLMHIAAAYKKPVISVWGNTVPAFGMFPYYGYNNLKERVASQSYIIENNELSCRPCSKLGHNKCPKGHFKCMKNLNMLKIAEIVKEMWKSAQHG